MERDFDIEIARILNKSEVPDLEFLDYHRYRGKMYSKSFRYNWQTGKVLLPNYWKFLISKFSFFKLSKLISITINRLPDDLTHEIMHKWLHENISDNACDLWENVDKIRGQTKYRFSSPDSPNFFERFTNIIDLS
jgi:hypothetical protein